MLGEKSDPEECLRFRGASTRALDLAMAHGDSTWVHQTDAGCKVAARPQLAELNEEIEDDRDHWALSDEEG